MNSPFNHPPIYIEKNDFEVLQKFLMEQYADKKIVILVDENTNKMCLHLLQSQVEALSDALVFEIPSGESSKNLMTCKYIWENLTQHNVNRNDLLINLGGGMISDVGGYVAASYKRGMDYINIPTSLLGQVDASIGGKTGVNLEEFKNLVGSIYLPKAVFIFSVFLKTLPKRQVYSGFAEIIKSALIADSTLWLRLLKIDQLRVELVETLVETTCDIKKQFVENDLYEKGKRKALNFGHTVGHALESYSMLHYAKPCFHGEAVAMGMICETFISFRLDLIEKLKMDEVIRFITSHFKKIEFSIADVQTLLETMKKDKKNVSSAYNFTLLPEIGKAVVNVEVEEKVIIESLNYLHHLQF